MYYLLSLLLLVGGGPKHVVRGYFSYEESARPPRAPALQICQSDDCFSPRLDEDLQFEVKLRAGTYQLHFSNRWRQEVVQDLNIQGEASLVLDYESFRPRISYPVWDAFLAQGMVTIAERSDMAGRDWERVITLHKMKGGVQLLLHDPTAEISAGKVLSQLELMQLEDFLRKVDLYHQAEGCDTPVLYLMQAGEETFIIEDSSCELQLLDTILYDLYVDNYVSQEFP